MIDVANGGTTMSRQFYFALPTGYAPTKAYRLIFAWHYAGGSAMTIASTTGGGVGRYYGMQPVLTDAIYVAPQGLESTPGDATTTGWPNTNGQDIAFARVMVTWFETNFCIDTGRIMSAGMSYGGIMSHTVGCQMSDVFKAIGVMSGSLFSANGCKTHQIAAWMTHGDADMTVPFTSGESARDRIVTLNHCQSTTQPVTPSPCVQYDGCDSGYPVDWCPVAGEGHTIPSFAASGIANFFAQF